MIQTVGGYFTWMTIYAVNQTMIQRYLTVKDLRWLTSKVVKMNRFKRLVDSFRTKRHIQNRSIKEIGSHSSQNCQDLDLAERRCHHCHPVHRCLCWPHHLHKVLFFSLQFLFIRIRSTMLASSYIQGTWYYHQVCFPFPFFTL